MFANLTESIAKAASHGWFKQLGYAVRPVTQLSSEGSVAERELFSDVLMVAQLCEAIHQLKPDIPLRAIATLRVALLTELLRVVNLPTSRGITQ
jgi:hypothetical protein